MRKDKEGEEEIRGRGKRGSRRKRRRRRRKRRRKEEKWKRAKTWMLRKR